MCMDERFFTKPKEFLPERWLRSTTGELAKSKEFPFAHKPFGYGPRSCLGQRFAETEIFIGISKVCFLVKLFSHFLSYLTPNKNKIVNIE